MNTVSVTFSSPLPMRHFEKEDLEAFNQEPGSLEVPRSEQYINEITRRQAENAVNRTPLLERGSD
jgi:hypothetical protein